MLEQRGWSCNRTCEGGEEILERNWAEEESVSVSERVGEDCVWACERFSNFEKRTMVAGWINSTLAFNCATENNCLYTFLKAALFYNIDLSPLTIKSKLDDMMSYLQESSQLPIKS